MSVIVYSTGCPKCRIIEKKLNEKGVTFQKETDVGAMLELGIQSVPVLDVNGEQMDFTAALQWISKQGE